jgi:hypothetical protein
VLTLHVQPGSRTTGIAGIHGDALKLRLAAPAVDGKANACLVAYFAELLQLPRNRVQLIAGATSRHKRLRVDAAPAGTAELLVRLAACAR